MERVKEGGEIHGIILTDFSNTQLADALASEKRPPNSAAICSKKNTGPLAKIDQQQHLKGG